MSDIAIRVENLSKQYRLGTINHGMLYKDLQSWWARVLGKDDPNAKLDWHGKQRDIDSAGHFWALKDISFEVKQGDVIGIIGRNGAGKSTLLKILSRVTTPTKGLVKVKGRIASLLEVGTGFHPELTGRENVYLNGAILGMTKKEIAKKFDEIVEFAELAEFIDTPVKRYSSGMYVRLAFAVAAHLEPEILLGDEVLAVGDAAFQKKCLGKMGDVSKQGRTVLFVSHNMASMQALCSKGIYLDNGCKIYEGDMGETIVKYLSYGKNERKREKDGFIFLLDRINTYYNHELFFKKIRLLDYRSQPNENFRMANSITIEIVFMKPGKMKFALGIIFNDGKNQRITGISNLMTCDIHEEITGDNIKATLTIPEIQFTPGRYYIDLSLVETGIGRIDFIENAAEFVVEVGDIYGTGYQFTNDLGVFYLSKPTFKITNY